MKRFICLSALLFPLLSFACTPDHVKFTNGQVRAMAPGQKVTAVYLEIENTSANTITITGVSSPDAPEAAIHKIVHKHHTAEMKQLDHLVLPPHSTIVLKPGSEHIMLMDLEKPLTPSSKPITLVFTYGDKSISTVNKIPVKDMSSREE